MIETLVGAGYGHYEVSNFARGGEASEHNQIYWRGEPYHAVGLGATSYVGGERATRERSLPAYLKLIESGEDAIVERTTLSERDRRRERLAFGLRMRAGVPLGRFAEVEGATPQEVGGEALARFAEQGLVEFTPSVVRLTARGLMFADTVMRELI